ncbi:MAG: hypothetical protein ABH823_03460 [bacterium]
MVKRLKKHLKNHFARLWLAVLLLALLVMGFHFLFSAGQEPSLQQVLSHDQLGNSPDLSMFIASLLAMSLATLSAAKGYEIFKRSRSAVEMIIPDLSEAEAQKNQEYEELRRREEELVLESVEYRDELQKLGSELDELKQMEPMLRQSNISLGQECERLKSENESLGLKLASLRPQLIKPAKKKGKAAIKVAAKTKVVAKQKKARKAKSKR